MRLARLFGLVSWAFDRVAFDRVAFDRVAFDRVAFDRVAFDHVAFDRMALTTCRLGPQKAAEGKTFDDILLTETFNCRLKFRFSSTFFLNKKLRFYHFCPPKLKPLWPL